LLSDLLGGPSQIRRFDLNGKNEMVIPIPQISAVQEMLALENGSLLFRDVLHRAGGVVPLRERKTETGEDGAAERRPSHFPTSK
jgi:hypothetical protein